MRRFVLATLLAAVATPARANTVADAITLCERLGGETNVCWMKNVSEDFAGRIAKATLDRCDKLNKELEEKNGSVGSLVVRHWDARAKQCTAEGAYIKQRWGY